MTDIRKEAEASVVQISVFGVDWFAIKAEASTARQMERSIKFVKNAEAEHHLLHEIVNSEDAEDLAEKIQKAKELLASGK